MASSRARGDLAVVRDLNIQEGVARRPQARTQIVLAVRSEGKSDDLEFTPVMAFQGFDQEVRDRMVVEVRRKIAEPDFSVARAPRNRAQGRILTDLLAGMSHSQRILRGG